MSTQTILPSSASVASKAFFPSTPQAYIGMKPEPLIRWNITMFRYWEGNSQPTAVK